MAKSPQRTVKRSTKRKLTDAERHKRFVDMAREVGASEDPKDFDRALKKVASNRKRPGHS